MSFIEGVTNNIWRYIPFILVIPIIVFQALSLSGCVSISPSIPGLYIVSFSKNVTNFPEIRLGYFGMCSYTNISTTCVPTLYSTPEDILNGLYPPTISIDKSPSPIPQASKPSTLSPLLASLLPIITAARTLQAQVFPAVLAGAGVCFVACLVLMALYKHSLLDPGKRDQSKWMRRAVIANLALSTALGLAACLSTWTAAKALQDAPLLFGGGGDGGKGEVLVRLGTEVQALQWLAFGFTVLFACGFPVMMRVGGEKY
ncbi:hypothetical protein GE09DRAFT_1277758 [Coniochaeta sp. 2T2.1]|nr:hypothetical protein GE09DRAFT_1277758 [Coniochaeta sp. 2T2.1]